MKISVRLIDRVTIDFEPGERTLAIRNPFHPRFHVVPARIIAELDHGKILNAVVIGQRYRAYADGLVKPVGPGRGHTSLSTTWEFPTRASMPQELITLLHDMNAQKEKS